MFKNIKYKIKDYLVEDFSKKKIFSFLSDEDILKVDYFLTFKRFLNLKRPKYFNEKLQWIKLHGNLEKHKNFADKYKVRKFVEKTIGKKYLIPLLGVWDKFEDIDFSKLPKKFVLKANHGSSYVYICKNKDKLNKTTLKKNVNKWLKENFYTKTKEPQYRGIKHRIICEKFMNDGSGGLVDYKFYCYNGQPKQVNVHIDRFTNHRSMYLTLDWEFLPIYLDREPDGPIEIPKRPVNFKEMVNVAQKLSKNFPFVRVDLYSVGKKIYFGELTFVPANGFLKFTDYNADNYLGSYLDLKKYKN